MILIRIWIIDQGPHYVNTHKYYIKSNGQRYLTDKLKLKSVVLTMFYVYGWIRYIIMSCILLYSITVMTSNTILPNKNDGVVLY